MHRSSIANKAPVHVVKLLMNRAVDTTTDFFFKSWSGISTSSWALTYSAKHEANLGDARQSNFLRAGMYLIEKGEFAPPIPKMP